MVNTVVQLKQNQALQARQENQDVAKARFEMLKPLVEQTARALGIKLALGRPQTSTPQFDRWGHLIPQAEFEIYKLVQPSKLSIFLGNDKEVAVKAGARFVTDGYFWELKNTKSKNSRDHYVVYGIVGENPVAGHLEALAHGRLAFLAS